jgi:hypothetical protein
VTRGRRDTRRTNSFNCLGTEFSPRYLSTKSTTGPAMGPVVWFQFVVPSTCASGPCRWSC